MNFCQNCGKQIVATATYCPYCGVKIKTALLEDSDQEPIQGRASNETNVRNEPQVLGNQNVQPQLNIYNSLVYVFKHTFEFADGPAESRRSVYWWFVLAVSILFKICYRISPVLGGALGLIVFLPNVSAIMRRLKYLNIEPYLALVDLCSNY